MHSEIEQDRPGNCPIRGMALEPKTPVGAGGEENSELQDMTRRFWMGAFLALPVMARVFRTPVWQIRAHKSADLLAQMREKAANDPAVAGMPEQPSSRGRGTTACQAP